MFFHNMTAGRFEPRQNVGAGGSAGLTNDGILSPGGDGVVTTTVLTGNWTQGATGRYVVDLDKSGGVLNADKINVTGTATLAGVVVVRTSGDIGKTGSIEIARTDHTGDLANNLGPLGRSGGYRFSLSDDGQSLILGWVLAPGGVLERVSESGSAVPSGHRAVATHLDHAAEAATGTEDSDDMVSAVADMSSGEARQAVGRLNPEHFSSRTIDTSQASQAFVASVMSCPTHASNPGFIQEGECFWAKLGARQFNWDQTAGNIGGKEEAWSTAGGVQVSLRDAWRLGFAGSYERSQASTLNAATTETDRGQGAVILKNRWDTVTVAGTVFAGYGWSQSQRIIGFGGLGPAESSHDLWFAGTQLRISQLFEQRGGWYLKPLIDLNATRLETDAFVEHGAGAANLSVAGATHALYSASPALEVGAQVQYGALTLRPFARVGGTFFSDASYQTTASFVAAPGTAFSVESIFDKHYVDVAAGIDVLAASGLDVKLTYDGRFSGHSEMHTGGLKASVPF